MAKSEVAAQTDLSMVARQEHLTRQVLELECDVTMPVHCRPAQNIEVIPQIRSSDDEVMENLNSQTSHIIRHSPAFSRLQPVIPRRYVPEWKTDMRNRDKLMKNATQAGIYPGPHDESLFLEKRERLNHGEKRGYVVTKTVSPPRKELLRPPFPSHMSKFQSELMYRRDPWEYE